MTELLNLLLPVHYGFIHLMRKKDQLSLERNGQSNGLAWRTSASQLKMITGLHTGDVSFAAEWHASEPALDGAWEDVVEVSIDIPQRDLVLATFDHHVGVEMPAVGMHRARYHANSMDAAHHMQGSSPGDLGPDRYLVQLWPGPDSPDRIVRQTSKHAAYWHSVAQRS